jgi:hypothetical protein
MRSLPGKSGAGILTFSKPDNSSLTVESRTDLRDASNQFIELRHVGAGPEQRPGEAYGIALHEVALWARTKSRLWLVCPVRHEKTQFLYLPPAADRFASSAAHDLLTESDRMCGGRPEGRHCIVCNYVGNALLRPARRSPPTGVDAVPRPARWHSFAYALPRRNRSFGARP